MVNINNCLAVTKLKIGELRLTRIRIDLGVSGEKIEVSG
jgi:hypothetical protein